MELDWNQKNVLVIGAGISGFAAAKLARRFGASVTLSDAKTEEELTKLGDDFAKQLMKGLSEEKGKSKLGPFGGLANRFTPLSFDYFIDGGIMYATVKMPFLVPIENHEIKFDRVPVQEYLRKVKEK